ncbi:hypothetical protein MUK42_10355 [Musa troglodytarum]|uniref:Uncharacterized protein n=1 Tax=Musa troglodytarum TaxID=320322 RepID=A0A9E7GPM4_9LILI|nr:hypothetical protein MUK42_10355 [Musa troglodytarum]
MKEIPVPDVLIRERIHSSGKSRQLLEDSLAFAKSPAILSVSILDTLQFWNHNKNQNCLESGLFWFRFQFYFPQNWNRRFWNHDQRAKAYDYGCMHIVKPYYHFF